ncbi:hypothetical protein [Cellulomonas aerilata]|uniref:Uncharacterized protein n=1 Tax=Cellulomonas aerilata TaxID=515326 RepID=A0A512DA01_9CELL|nr:hypothetical protein [Cellulomonas aerilata]GEO33275.1 hypothetical protein CAE01nite_10000 [Cellulomonas aerilata]
MPSSQFTPVWDALSPELRWALLQHPSRPLAFEHVDELVSAGGRHAHAVWFDSRPGHPRQWATSWQFRRFVEQHRDAEQAARAARERPWFGGRTRGRLPLLPG